MKGKKTPSQGLPLNLCNKRKSSLNSCFESDDNRKQLVSWRDEKTTSGASNAFTVLAGYSESGKKGVKGFRTRTRTSLERRLQQNFASIVKSVIRAVIRLRKRKNEGKKKKKKACKEKRVSVRRRRTSFSLHCLLLHVISVDYFWCSWVIDGLLLSLL